MPESRLCVTTVIAYIKGKATLAAPFAVAALGMPERMLLRGCMIISMKLSRCTNFLHEKEKIFNPISSCRRYFQTT
jgi:hypothetical protein